MADEYDDALSRSLVHTMLERELGDLDRLENVRVTADRDLVHATDELRDVIRLRQAQLTSINQILGRICHLPLAGHAHDSERAFRILLSLRLADDVGGVDLAHPACRRDIAVATPFGVVKADHGGFKRHCDNY